MLADGGVLFGPVQVDGKSVASLALGSHLKRCSCRCLLLRFSLLETRYSRLVCHRFSVAYSGLLYFDTDAMTPFLVQPCRIILSQCPRRGYRPYFPDPPLPF